MDYHTIAGVSPSLLSLALPGEDNLWLPCLLIHGNPSSWLSVRINKNENILPNLNFLPPDSVIDPEFIFMRNGKLLFLYI